MSETTTETTPAAPAKPKLDLPVRKPKMGRRSLKALGRLKRKLKVRGDAEFAKAFFDGKSKRSVDKKSAYRKKKKGKK